MSINFRSVSTYGIEDVLNQQEDMFMNQISDLISKGILVVTSSKPIITHSCPNDRYQLSWAVEIKSKEHEYIKRLEARCEELEKKLANIRKESE